MTTPHIFIYRTIEHARAIEALGTIQLTNSLEQKLAILLVHLRGG